MENFNEKVVIVTGSSTGIGRAIALRFAKAGAAVVIHGQSEERLKQTEHLLCTEAHAGSCRVLRVRGSVEDESTLRELIDATIAKFGRIDVLVNNVGAMQMNDVDPESMENFDFVFNVNLKSVVRLTQLAVPYLEKTKGNIVNVSSIAGQVPFEIAVFYAMAKAGVEHFTRNMAMKLAPKGIRVNCIAPGFIPTEFLSRAGHDDEQAQKMAQTRVPQQRPGTPEECAAVIGFLAGSAASYVTGAVWHVDGGLVSTFSFVSHATTPK